MAVETLMGCIRDHLGGYVQNPWLSKLVRDDTPAFHWWILDSRGMHPKDWPSEEEYPVAVSLTMFVPGKEVDGQLSTLECRLDLLQEHLKSQDVSSVFRGPYKYTDPGQRFVILNFVVWVSEDPPGYGWGV